MTSSSSKPSSAETAKQIKALLKELPEERADAARLDELRRVFGRLVTNGDLTFSSSNTGSSEIASKWNAYLQKQHRIMVSQLCKGIEQGRRTAVRTMWGVIAASPMVAQNQQYRHVHADLLHQWMRSMISLELDDKTLRHMVEQEFLHPYRDVQYYALVAIARLATDGYGSMSEDEAERLLKLLLMVPIPTSQDEMDTSNYLFPPPKDMNVEKNTTEDNSDSESSESEEDSSSDDEVSSDEEEEETIANSRKRKRDAEKKASDRSFAFQQLKSHRKALSNAWLAVLKLSLPTVALKHALQFLPVHVLPNVPNPLRFADFFIQAYNHKSSGFTSLLALDGLFCLMTEHGLEHEKFYESLYSLVQPRMLYAKHKTRFLELLTKCLCNNEMLPAHVVAAFCKRLLRSSLSAPPSGALFCIALSANLLRQHPECACLIHRSGTELTDVFDNKTNDLSQSQALESSLWELAALSQHYYPAVAALAKSVGTEDAKTPLHDMDDFLRHTYKSLFTQERKRGDVTSKKRQKLLAATPLTFVKPTGLFTDKDVFASMLAVPKQNESKD